jgi:hypothetical protein
VKRLVVNQEHDHLAACIVPVEVVARDAQPILGDLAEADQSEHEPSNRRPQKQLPWRRFDDVLLALRAQALFPSQLAAHACARKGYQSANRSEFNALATRQAKRDPPLMPA